MPRRRRNVPSSARADFGKFGRLPVYWCNKSSDLHAAAGTLWAAMTPSASKALVAQLELGLGFDMRAALPSVYRMLCGLSLELMYKAILVCKAQDPPPHHDLVSLAAAAGVETTPRERALLKILTAAIVWDGRYPIPRTPSEQRTLQDLELKHLTERVGGYGKLVVVRSNRALSWTGYSDLWSLAFGAYLEAEQRMPRDVELP